MKRFLMTVVLLGMTSTVWAQASSMTQQAGSGDSPRIYVGAVVGVTFGNVTSSTFGGEVGFRIGSNLEIFGEGGRMTDVTSSTTESAAQSVADWLGTLGKGAATFSAATPVNYGAFGARYLFSLSSSVEPYVAMSLGVANVEHNTTFTLNGTDVTESLPFLGVQLGADLSGRSNEFLLTAGGGVRVPVGPALLDAGIRYGRIFSDPGIDTFRLYAGAGFRF